METSIFERAEVHRHVPVSVRSVGHAEQEDVPLVALDGFEILDEHGFKSVRGRKGRLDLPVRRALFVQKILDQGLLFGVESDDTDRSGADGRITMRQPADDLGHDGFRFPFVVLGAVACVEPCRSHEADRAVVYFGGREDDKSVSVVPFVGERDQTFLARSVVQVQRLLGDAGAQHFIQDALHFRIDVRSSSDCAKKLVGGICFGSPATMIYQPRTMEPSLEKIRAGCPRFDEWATRLEAFSEAV